MLEVPLIRLTKHVTRKSLLASKPELIIMRVVFMIFHYTKQFQCYCTVSKLD